MCILWCESQIEEKLLKEKRQKECDRVKKKEKETAGLQKGGEKCIEVHTREADCYTQPPLMRNDQ